MTQPWGRILGLAVAVLVLLLAVGWSRRVAADALAALTAAAVLGIVALGSLRPLVVKLYAPTTQQFNRLAGWLLVVHPALFAGAALALFRLLPNQSGALLLGLVVVPVAIVVEAILQVFRGLPR